MKTTSLSAAQVGRPNAFLQVGPIVVSIGLFLVVVAVRSIDLFVLRLDEFPDPTMVSRILGSLLVLGYLWVLQKPISSIGLQAQNFNKAFLIGGVSLVSWYAILYGIQFYLLSAAGETPRLVFAAINEKTAALAGLSFTLVVLCGQVLNAFMEESIFRGLMLPNLMRQFRFWQANLLQAFLFGLAHLIFPLCNWVRGQVTLEEAVAQAIPLLIATTVGGLVFGYLYYRTGSLWTSVFAHLIDNVIGLFFHIQTVSRLNAETDILMLASLGFISLVFVAWIVAKRSQLPTLNPWGTQEMQ